PVVISEWRHALNGGNPVISGFHIGKAAPLALLFGANNFFIDANEKLSTCGICKGGDRFGKSGGFGFDGLQIDVVAFLDLKNTIRLGTAYFAFVDFLGHDTRSVSRLIVAPKG